MTNIPKKVYLFRLKNEYYEILKSKQPEISRYVSTIIIDSISKTRDSKVFNEFYYRSVINELTSKFKYSLNEIIEKIELNSEGFRLRLPSRDNWYGCNGGIKLIITHDELKDKEVLSYEMTYGVDSHYFFQLLTSSPNIEDGVILGNFVFNGRSSFVRLDEEGVKESMEVGKDLLKSKEVTLIPGHIYLTAIDRTPILYLGSANMKIPRGYYYKGEICMSSSNCYCNNSSSQDCHSLFVDLRDKRIEDIINRLNNSKKSITLATFLNEVFNLERSLGASSSYIRGWRITRKKRLYGIDKGLFLTDIPKKDEDTYLRDTMSRVASNNFNGCNINLIKDEDVKSLPDVIDYVKDSIKESIIQSVNYIAGHNSFIPTNGKSKADYIVERILSGNGYIGNYDIRYIIDGRFVGGFGLIPKTDIIDMIKEEAKKK